jgi:replicative DNA helicase
VSLAVEQQVLGSLLLDPEAWAAVADTLSTEHFERTEHQVILKAVAALGRREMFINLLTVRQRLGRMGKLKAAGGEQYLSQLVRETSSAGHLYEHVRHLCTSRLNAHSDEEPPEDDVPPLECYADDEKRADARLAARSQ